MNVDEITESIDRKFDKNLTVFKTKVDVARLEEHLIFQIEKYIVEIETLQNELSTYKKLHKGKSLKINYEALVKCAVGAKYLDIGSFGTSLGYVSNYNVFSLLGNKLTRIGRIGTKSILKNSFGKSNRVGKCAEVKASYAIHNKRKIKKLGDIEFTNAYRPRTCQIVDMCDNCLFIFDHV